MVNIFFQFMIQNWEEWCINFLSAISKQKYIHKAVSVSQKILGMQWKYVLNVVYFIFMLYKDSILVNISTRCRKISDRENKILLPILQMHVRKWTKNIIVTTSVSRALEKMCYLIFFSHLCVKNKLRSTLKGEQNFGGSSQRAISILLEIHPNP